MKYLFTLVITAVSFAFCQAQQVYSLEQICDLARNNNIAIRTARHNIEEAQLQRKEAFTNYFPNVSATGLWFNANKGLMETSINPQDLLPQELSMMLAQSLPPEMLAPLANPINVSMMKNGTIASIMAVQPVFTGGRIINGNRLAKVGEEVSHLQLELSENDVEKTAEQYFWQLASLQEKIKTINAAQALLSTFHKDTQLAVNVGVAMRNDLLQVQLRENELVSQKMKLNNGISMVKMMMCQYCGLRDTAYVITYDTDVVSPAALKQNHDLAVLNTTEYKLLGKQVEASRLQEKITWGQNLPQVAVGAGYNYHNLLDKNHSFAMVFATVNIPISSWWGGSHANNRSKLETQKAQEQLADNTQLLIIRMQNAWNGVEEAYNQLQLAQLSIEQASENLRMSKDQYGVGVSKMSDLLEAQLLYQKACDQRTDAFIEYQTKILEYRLATGQ
ncbi:MAG: TolC family protein [Muribaculaceae bacterium]|nr:TolC family protein [Muribaculaceae bacterium]